MSNKKKRGDNVASPRSRKGQIEQDKLTRTISQFAMKISENIRIEVEPNADTINNIINKKDKKKVN